MNENLKNVIQTVGTDTSGKWVSTDNIEIVAKLIVRECDRYARSAWEHGELLGGDLKRHFGIDE